MYFGAAVKSTIADKIIGIVIVLLFVYDTVPLQCCRRIKRHDKDIISKIPVYLVLKAAAPAVPWIKAIV